CYTKTRNMETDRQSKLLDLIYEVYNNIGSRTAGSKDEELAARFLKSVFAQNSDSVETEIFKCNPKSVLYFINFLFICYCCALFVYLMSPELAFFIIAFTFFNLLLFRLYSIRLLDFILPKYKSQNIIAKIKPQKEVK